MPFHFRLAVAGPPGPSCAAQQRGKPLKTEWIVLAAVVGAAIYLAVIYNGLVRFRNLAREGWSGIDVQLRRRNDLVPNSGARR